MKKHYALLASALMLSLAGFSQEKVRTVEAEAKLSEADFVPTKMSIKTPKAYGDTFPNAYFDFNGGLPAGWLVYENANTGFNWSWSQTAPRGQYTNEPVIASTTGSNGFMMLESDFYNTPIPASGAVNMDAYFESGPIPIQSVGSVLLRFQQSFRICCSSGLSELDVEVRSSLTAPWDTFSVKEGIPINSATPNPLFTEINISSAAANSDTIYFRFHQSGASHYYWMIDDIAVVEGPSYDLVMDDFGVNYNDFSSHRRQFYEQIPLAMFDTMWVHSTVINNGGLADSGQVVYQISQDLNCFGAPGAGPYAYVHENLPTIAPLSGLDVSFNDPFLPPAKGQYTISAFVQSANMDQVSSNNTLSNSFTVSDTVYAKDDGSAESTIGPHSYVGFDHDGATLYLYYEMQKPQVATSLSYYIASSRSIGAGLTAQLWGVDTSGACSTSDWSAFNLTSACFSPAPVASYPFPITIDTPDVNTWITVPIAPTLLNQYPAYAIAYEASGYQHDANGNVTVGLSVGNDMDANDQGAYNGSGSYDLNTMLSNSAKNDYGTAGGTPMMRINFGQLSDTCFLVGAEEEAAMRSAFEIYPNPSNGQFNVKISTELAKDYTLTVTNMLGQNVHSEEISVNNEEINKNMNFSNLEKGIYFVTIQNAAERHTQKIVIR